MRVVNGEMLFSAAWLDGPCLTRRQLEVLSSAATGETIAETARRTWHSPETVRIHRKRAIANLGARNMTHAVVLALRAGLLDDATP